MNIHSPILRMACLLALAFGLGGAASAARGTLHLDGILQIRGGAASSARIVVLPTGGMPYAMDNVSGRFKMSLPLDGTYLLSFEREGLVTKQVYFDTSVPLDKFESELSFLFKVTLFSFGKNDVYEYAGPVGFVHYDAGKADFDYETDYTLKPGMPMFKRITTLMAQMEDRGTDGLPKAVVVSYRASNAPAGSALVVAPEVPVSSQVERSLPDHAEGALIDIRDGTVGDVPEDDPVREVLPVAQSTTAMHVEDHASTGIPVRVVGRAAEKPLEILDNRARSQRRTPNEPQVDPLSLPTEELIVERNRVITVVRVPEGTGHVSEYRRVADRHGMVVHFRDGVQIPEQIYREGTGR